MKIMKYKANEDTLMTSIKDHLPSEYIEWSQLHDKWEGFCDKFAKIVKHDLDELLKTTNLAGKRYMFPCQNKENSFIAAFTLGHPMLHRITDDHCIRITEGANYVFQVIYPFSKQKGIVDITPGSKEIYHQMKTAIDLINNGDFEITNFDKGVKIVPVSELDPDSLVPTDHEVFKNE